MSTDMTWSTHSSGSAQTERLAESIGRRLKGHEVIELASDLGGGKTTFTRGLARAAGSGDVVGSPTFTLSKLYETPNFSIKHYDFYRLAEPGLMQEELAEALEDSRIVVLVEWAEIVESVLPEARLRITFTTTGEFDRDLQFTYPTSLAYLMQDIIEGRS